MSAKRKRHDNFTEQGNDDQTDSCTEAKKQYSKAKNSRISTSTAHVEGRRRESVLVPAHSTMPMEGPKNKNRNPPTPNPEPTEQKRRNISIEEGLGQQGTSTSKSCKGSKNLTRDGEECIQPKLTACHDLGIEDEAFQAYNTQEQMTKGSEFQMGDRVLDTRGHMREGSEFPLETPESYVRERMTQDSQCRKGNPVIGTQQQMTEGSQFPVGTPEFDMQEHMTEDSPCPKASRVFGTQEQITDSSQFPGGTSESDTLEYMTQDSQRPTGMRVFGTQEQMTEGSQFPGGSSESDMQECLIEDSQCPRGNLVFDTHVHMTKGSQFPGSTSASDMQERITEDSQFLKGNRVSDTEEAMTKGSEFPGSTSACGMQERMTEDSEFPIDNQVFFTKMHMTPGFQYPVGNQFFHTQVQVPEGYECPGGTPVSDMQEDMTECSECLMHTPVSETNYRPRRPPLTSKRQKELFSGRSEKVKRREEKRKWTLDRRRKDLDHGKFTEDELINLDCGLNDLMAVRNWDKETAVNILTHSNGRGKPHEEARGAWKEITKFLPTSSIVRVNMKARSLLQTVKTGKWDPEEINMLKRLVKEHGNDWIAISTKLGRSNTSCALKWRTVKLDETRPRKRGKWTQEEYDELCHLVREAKETRILTYSRKAGNRQVKDNLPWEPIAFKMGRPHNQCSAVWYDRLAPALDKEQFLSEEDRQWADEDDRRLLKRMIRVLSRGGEISWPEVCLRNRKPATCKARFNQMIDPRCLGGGQAHASLQEQLKVLVRRYAPDLTLNFRVEHAECSKKSQGESEEEDSGEICQVRQGEECTEETSQCKINENKHITDGIRRKSGRSDHRSDGELEESLNQLSKEDGELSKKRNFDMECEESQNRLPDRERSEVCYLREEELVVDLHDYEGERQMRDKAVRKWKDRKTGKESTNEDSSCKEEEKSKLRTCVGRPEEGGTSKMIYFGNIDRNVELLTKQSKRKKMERNSEIDRSYCVKNESHGSFDCQINDKNSKETQYKLRSRNQNSDFLGKSFDSRSPRETKSSHIEDEDLCTEDEGSTSLEF